VKTAFPFFIFFLLLAANKTQEADHPQVTVSSEAFRNSLLPSLNKLDKLNFPDGLETPGLGSIPDDQFQRLVAEIRAETPIADVSVGKRGIKYDAILQPGHYGRTIGAVGTAGQFVSERALAAYLTDKIAMSLRSSGLSVLVISADNYLKPASSSGSYDGLQAKAFLAIHADGSRRPCSTGPSLAYQSNSSLLAMHAVGWSLAAALGYKYTDFNKDNFTANEAKYYMFEKVRTERLNGLLEVGELTCPASEKQLITNSKLIGGNVARAITFIVQTPSE
jgi:hypothetical protein